MPNAFLSMPTGGICALLAAVICSGPPAVGSIRTTEEEHTLEPQASVSTTTAASCPLAAPHEETRNTFVVDAVLVQELSLWQVWTLRTGSGCKGAPVGEALLTPEIDPVNPTSHSQVLITINDTQDVGPTLSVCASEPNGRCVAELRIPERPRGLVDFFSGVLSSRTVRAFKSLHPNLAMLFEVLLAVALVVVIFTVVWFIYLAHSAIKAPEQVWGLTESEDLSDRHLKLPKPADIISLGLIDVLFFVIGCGLFVLEGERLFRTYHDPSGAGYILVLCFPLLFGCAAVLRIFLATARCHLYYESLRSGILLKFTVNSSMPDPLLLWFWLGIVITLGATIKVVWADHSSISSDIQALLVFASPIYYMTSSILDIQYAEDAALKSECVLGLEGICNEKPMTIGAKNNISPMHESTFVSLAREHQAINSTSSSQSQMASADRLEISDLRWVAAVSRRKATGLNRLFLLLYDPTLVCTLLCLALLSCTVCFRKITSKPEMLHLQVIGGTLATGFSPQMKDYSVFLEQSQASFIALNGEVDPSQTARFSVLDAKGHVQGDTSGSSLSDAFAVDSKEIYPVKRKFVVADSTSTSDYRVQMLHVGVLPSRVTFVAETLEGKTFRRCVPWGYFWDAAPIVIPPSTTSLQMEMEVLHYVADIPSSRRINDRFSTIFQPNMSKEACSDFYHNKQVVTTWHAKHGCWAVYQPAWAACDATRRDLTSQFLQHTDSSLSGTACAKRNGIVANGCVPLQQTAPGVSLLTANVTNFMPKDAYTDFSTFSTDLFVYQGNNTDSYSPMTAGEWYNPQQGIRLSMKQTSNWEVMMAHGYIDGVYVSSNGFRTEQRKERGWVIKPWPLWIHDSQEFKEALKQAKNMTIIFISTDLDCWITAAEAKGVDDRLVLEQVEPPPVTCSLDFESEACNLGVRKTTAFLLPLDYFRNYSSRSNFQALDIFGHRSCASMAKFESNNEPFLVTAKLVFEPYIDAVPFVPTQPEQRMHWNWECIEEAGCFLTVHRLGNTFMPRTNMTELPWMGIILILDTNCSVSINWVGSFVTGDAIDTTLRESQIKPEQKATICSYSSMKQTKMCGGYYDAAAYEFQVAGVWEDASQTELTLRYDCGWLHGYKPPPDHGQVEAYGGKHQPYVSPKANVVLSLIDD